MKPSAVYADQDKTASQTDARPRKKIQINRAGGGGNEMSLEELRQEIKKAPNNALLYYRAGFMEEQRGNLVQALRDYQESINQKARVAEAYYRSGVVWEKTGEFYELRSTDKGRMINGEQRQRALDSYRAAIRVRPDFADAYYRLSLVHLLGDEMREANEAYQKLHQLEPDTDRTRQLLLMIYKHHQQQSRAKK